jgi:hypothetical protein
VEERSGLFETATAVPLASCTHAVGENLSLLLERTEFRVSLGLQDYIAIVSLLIPARFFTTSRRRRCFSWHRCALPLRQLEEPLSNS